MGSRSSRKRKLLAFGPVAVLLVTTLCWIGATSLFSGKKTDDSNEQPGLKSAALPLNRGDHRAVLTRISDRIRNGETLSGALQRYAISRQDIHQLAASLNGELDLKQIKPGDVFVLEQNLATAPGQPVAPSAGGIARLDAVELIHSYPPGAPVRYRATRQQEQGGQIQQAFLTHRIETPLTQRVSTLAGRIDTNLYDGIVKAGGDPTLVNRFADVFGWQVDFYRETQKNDAFKMLVESNYADGRFVGYGRVLAAEYENAGRKYQGFYYRSPDGKITGVYDAKGNSLERSFLKSPMELARITSRYGQRFHPILGRRMPHNGIDYGARNGTPFWSIADGVVMEAGLRGAAGKMIRIRHKNGFITEYFHASRIAPGIQAGARIKQRQVIGYVGTTGRSTGPHLHFGMKLNSRYVNPSRQLFPAGTPLPRNEVAKFVTEIQPRIAELEQLPSQNQVAIQSN